jgi:hypothetical protein
MYNRLMQYIILIKKIYGIEINICMRFNSIYFNFEKLRFDSVLFYFEFIF